MIRLPDSSSRIAPMTSSSSSDIIDRLIDGDEQVLGEQFARHRDRLWRMVHFRLDHRLLGRVDADDILQEAYLDAAQRTRHLADSRPPSVFLWLRMIVLQTLINVHRRHLGAKMRDAAREVSLQAGWSHPTSVSLAAKLLDSITSPSGAAIREELTLRLEEALDSLAPIDREVLVLRHFEELSNSEVAEVLQIQQKAASIRYVRALSRLQNVLSSIPGYGLMPGEDDDD